MFRNRIPGYGTREEDPATDRVYYVADDENGIPNAVPAIKTRTLSDITYSVNNQNDYVPTMNRYEVIEAGEAKMVRVIPKEQTEDLDFGWSEFLEDTLNRNHSTMIPTAGKKFQHGKKLPDLLIKMVVSMMHKYDPSNDFSDLQTRHNFWLQKW